MDKMPDRLSSSCSYASILLVCLVGLTGCEHFDVRDAASHLPPYQNPVDRPKTLIDIALDHCPDKTEDREISCVKTALADSHMSIAALVAMVPSCRPGHVCAYHHVTEDRLGYVPAIAEDFVAHWRVSFDFRHASQSVSDIPVSVEQEE